MSDPATPFRLLDLPTELREQILRYALQVPYQISPRVYIPRDAFVLRLPALTKTCHILRKESLPLYFEENIFDFHLKDVLESTLDQDLRFEKKLLTFGAWCEAAGAERVSRIRRVSIDLTSGGGRWGVHVPNVLLTMGRFGKVEVELRYLRPDQLVPKYEIRPTPERLVHVARDSLEWKQGTGCMLPEGMVKFCTEVVLAGPGELLRAKA